MRLLSGGDEQQELQGHLVGPVSVLEHENVDTQSPQQLLQSAEQAMPRRLRIVKGLQCRRQVRGPFREQRP